MLETDASASAVVTGEVEQDHYIQMLSQSQLGILGIFAGGIACFADNPWIYCKTTTQQGLKISFNPRVMYRGLTANILNTASLTGIQFWGCGWFQKLMTGGKVRDLTLMEELTSGFMGGVVSGPACCLLELFMIQQQRFGGSMAQTYSRLAARGFGTFTRGMITSTLREAVFTVGYIAVAPIAERACQKNNIPGAVLMGSVVSGIITGALTQPIDTVKTCMQGDVERATYTNIRQTSQNIIAQNGLKSLWTGFFWRTGGMTVTVFVFNKARQILAPPLYNSGYFKF